MAEDESNFTETDRCVRGLRTRAEAESLRELTLRVLTKLKQDEKHLLRIEERDGLFDLIVLARVN